MSKPVPDSRIRKLTSYINSLKQADKNHIERFKDLEERILILERKLIVNKTKDKDQTVKILLKVV